MRNSDGHHNKKTADYKGIDLGDKSAYPQAPERIRPPESQNRVRCTPGSPKLSSQTLAKPPVQRGATRPGEYLGGGQLEQRSKPGANILCRQEARRCPTSHGAGDSTALKAPFRNKARTLHIGARYRSGGILPCPGRRCPSREMGLACIRTGPRMPSRRGRTLQRPEAPRLAHGSCRPVAALAVATSIVPG